MYIQCPHCKNHSVALVTARKQYHLIKETGEIQKEEVKQETIQGVECIKCGKSFNYEMTKDKITAIEIYDRSINSVEETIKQKNFLVS